MLVKSVRRTGKSTRTVLRFLANEDKNNFLVGDARQLDYLQKKFIQACVALDIPYKQTKQREFQIDDRRYVFCTKSQVEEHKLRGMTDWSVRYDHDRG